MPNSASANAAMASNGLTGLGQPALVGPKGIKALKSQLDRLVAAKALTAADPLLAHVSVGLEAQIQGVRNQLSSAQPVEVALRGTLGAVSTARQALTKAEQKATRLESQVVSAVAAYEAAAQDVQACKKALADAEEATARTAGGRFDPRLLMGSHPGAALAVLSEAAAARCVVGAPGVDASVIARVQAAFQEVQAACRILPADVPPPRQSETSGNGQGGTPPNVAFVAPPVSQNGEAASGGIIGGPHGAAPQGGGVTTGGNATSAQAASAAQQHLQQHLQQQQAHQQQQQQQQLLQQQALAEKQQQALAHQQAAQQQAQNAAAELARQHAQAALEQAAQLAAAQAAAAAGPVPPPVPAVPPSDDGDSLNDPHETQTKETGLPGAGGVLVAEATPPAPTLDHHVAGSQLGDGQPGAAANGGEPRDDSMGGGAKDGIVNKRTAAEAVASARAIAAKAKARAS